MIRRDTEKKHNYADDVFSLLSIFDIQGLLKEGNDYKCGIESYHVSSFDMVNFSGLDQKVEYARFRFCTNLGIPYFLVITSEREKYFKIFRAYAVDFQIIFQPFKSFTSHEFVNWWRSNQSFTQKKKMYNAASRISKSILDTLLFENNLSWGVNIDGFILDETKKTVAIVEKRICTYKPPYTIENYDPNRFFHGTRFRSGDFPSWSILFSLSRKLNAALLLFTFDTSSRKKIGAACIDGVSEFSGIVYRNGIGPTSNIFTDDVFSLDNWVNEVI
jgi:hypothetical protein